MTSKFKHHVVAAALASVGLILAGVAALPPAIAQPDGNTRAAPETTLRVIVLKHTSVKDFARVAGSVVRDPFSSVSYDERTNAVVVRGTSSTIDTLMDLVEMLDVPVAKGSGDERVEVFSLEHAQANPLLIETLDDVLGRDGQGHQNLRLSYDQLSNQLVARGESRALAQLSALVKELDRPAPFEQQSGDIDVRLIWLTSGAKGKVPADLEDVTDALEEVGIEGLGMVAQTIVRTTNRSDFMTEFATGGDEPWRVRFGGSAQTTDAEHWTMEVSLSGRQANPSPETFPGSVEFDTRLSTQSGHYVVLGVAPIGDVDSVFVLQIIDAD
jgi:Bacterial type II/III secretion system short domain